MADADFVPWEQREGWTDIKPIPQADTENPLVPINYSPAYVSAMSAFRYILEQEELSKRVLELTAEIVKFNPGHYTVWAYRGKTLLALKESEPDGDDILVKELSLLDALVKVHLKNYQVWQHRRLIVLALNDPSRELNFTTRALAFDSKNYHTWAYRQWAFSHFFEKPESQTYQKDCEDELEFTKHLLLADVRNNSAWNHRFFIVFRRTQPAPADIVQREIDFTKSKISMAPNNASAWNYLRGYVNASFGDHLEWARTVRSPADPEAPVMLAIEFVADALTETKGKDNLHEAIKLYDQLGREIDVMRENFWRFKRRDAEALLAV